MALPLRSELSSAAGIPASQASPTGLLARRIAWALRPEYLVLLVFGAMLVALRLAYGLSLRGLLAVTRGQLSVRYALSLMGLFALASLLGNARQLLGPDRAQRWAAARQALGLVRDWLPFIACLWIYENLHDLTLWIRPDTVDAALARADEALFGVQPTLWLQRIVSPLLNDYMALAYMTYFVFPPLLAGWLYLRGHLREFKELQLGMLIAFYVGFLGYIAVPAVGPQLILREQYSVPLEGWLFYQRIKQVVLSLQSFPRDCFPSMHTAISSVTLFYYLRHRRLTPWPAALGPLVVALTASLWFSTVYLRYHWFVDVLAGWGVAALACAGGVQLVRRWPSRPERS
jgi:membrane-associated phospholipid phosphatase